MQIVGEDFGDPATAGDVVGLAVFGSWAARYFGEIGPDPADIDVLVVVEDAGIDREPIYAAADRAARRLGRPVNPTVVTSARWAHRGRGEDPFLDQIASRPMVTAPLAGTPAMTEVIS